MAFSVSLKIEMKYFFKEIVKISNNLESKDVYEKDSFEAQFYVFELNK